MDDEIVKQEKEKQKTKEKTEEKKGDTIFNIPEITLRNKNYSREEFFKQSKHFFIMCDGGKPIYSRYGDYLEHCGIFATYSAITTKLTIFNSDDTFKEKLQ